MRLDKIVDAAVVAGEARPELMKLQKATQDLEAVFLKDLLSAMRRTVPKEEGEGGYGTDVYQDMFDQALAQSAGKSGGLGIAKTFYERMAPLVVAQTKTQLKLQAEKPKTENQG